MHVGQKLKVSQVKSITYRPVSQRLINFSALLWKLRLKFG